MCLVRAQARYQMIYAVHDVNDTFICIIHLIAFIKLRSKPLVDGTHWFHLFLGQLHSPVYRCGGSAASRQGLPAAFQNTKQGLM